MTQSDTPQRCPKCGKELQDLQTWTDVEHYRCFDCNEEITRIRQAAATPRPIRQAGKHLRSITTPVKPTGQDDPESDVDEPTPAPKPPHVNTSVKEWANCACSQGPCPVHDKVELAAAPTGTPRNSIAQPITYPGTLSNCCNAPIVEHDDMCCTKCGYPCSPTGTGEGSAEEWAKQIYAILNLGGHVKLSNTTIALLAERLDAYADALRSQLAEVREQLDTEAEAFDVMRQQFERAGDRYETAERDLATMTKKRDECANVFKMDRDHELTGSHPECGCPSCNLRRDLATAQARIAHYEEVLRKIEGHACYECAADNIASDALAEPPSGERQL